MAGARRSRCPVSCTLDVLGDRWTLLVVRDLMRGKHRFGEMAGSSEGIPTNLLAERLRRLKAEGLIRSRRYSSAPPRVEYVLTAKGEALRPILRAMVDWGVHYAGGRQPSPVSGPAAARDVARSGTPPARIPAASDARRRRASADATARPR